MPRTSLFPLLAVGLLAGILAASAVSAAGEAPVVSLELELPQPWSLDLLWARLRPLEEGRGSDKVRILQLGDSHTAGDRLSGRLRELFQTRFGDGGRGMLPAGKPWVFFRPQQVSVGQTGGVEVRASMRDAGGGPFGLSGFRSRVKSPRDSLWLETDPARPFSKAAVEMVVGPEAGTLRVRLDGEPSEAVSARRTATGVASVALRVPRPACRLELSPEGDGPVELLSWTVEGEGEGVVYDSHGIVGATVDLLGRWDPAVVADELRERSPSLILLEFGTNEGFDDGLDVKAYGERLRGYLRQLRQAAPDAAVLVLGPPDAGRLPKRCTAVKARKTKRGKKKRPVASGPLPCAPPASLSPRCAWREPPNVGRVREAQRRVALEEGCVFWDWAKAMGGPCTTHLWSLLDPPLARRDRVHLEAAGYAASAEGLFGALLRDYEGYKARASR